MRTFLRTETGGTTVLLAATVIGLIWANLPGGGGYERFWHTTLALTWGDAAFSLDLRHWVNDGLMTVFFFAIGLEISREVRIGQLRDRRLIAVPALAALGGMVFPALIYLSLNAGGPGHGGWGIPLASDTAFVLGLMAVLGARCPEPLRAFLLTLAVVDDVGAILVVALFYAADVSLASLAIAAGLLVVVFAVRWLPISRGPAYVALGFGLWLATFEGGVHPTIVGILMGALVNVYAPGDQHILRAGELVSALTREPSPELAREATRTVRQSVSINERLQLQLHPWTSYVIVPIFALANAGVVLNSESLTRAATSPITWGIAGGLVLGKFIGITLGTWLPLRLNLGDLPGSLVWGQVFGGAAISGIGFTVSLFITDLAFEDPVLQSQAKIGILAGSLVAAALGWIIFHLAWDRGGICAPATPDEEVEPYDGPLLDPVTEDDHARGPADAPVTLVEYGDFECPYCGAANRVLEELRGRYGDRLRVVFRHYPLRDIHPHAGNAALAAEEAADQGKFWEMHDLLYDNQLALTDYDLMRYKRELDVVPFQNAAGNFKRVKRDEKSAKRNGVRGTPGFFLNGYRYEGGHDVQSFARAIDFALGDRDSPE
ncbi:MAG: Na+/H+ antiporter NhaA [Streptosporangiales bacterium]|nr:Na+/H+ antiporter NhaA [Streptosporangiales bacterium]